MQVSEVNVGEVRMGEGGLCWWGSKLHPDQHCVMKLNLETEQRLALHYRTAQLVSEVPDTFYHLLNSADLAGFVTALNHLCKVMWL